MADRRKNKTYIWLDNGNNFKSLGMNFLTSWSLPRIYTEANGITSSLFLREVREQDSGYYSCKVGHFWWCFVALDIIFNFNYYYYLGGGQPCRDPALRHPRHHIPQPWPGPEMLTWSQVHNQVSPQWSLYRALEMHCWFAQHFRCVVVSSHGTDIQWLKSSEAGSRSYISGENISIYIWMGQKETNSFSFLWE